MLDRIDKVFDGFFAGLQFTFGFGLIFFERAFCEVEERLVIAIEGLRGKGVKGVLEFFLRFIEEGALLFESLAFFLKRGFGGGASSDFGFEALLKGNGVGGAFFELATQFGKGSFRGGGTTFGVGDTLLVLRANGILRHQFADKDSDGDADDDRDNCRNCLAHGDSVMRAEGPEVLWRVVARLKSCAAIQAVIQHCTWNE